MIMKKTAVIYWSGTGNTEAMAQAVLAGMQEAGAEAALYTTAEVTPALFDDLTGVAFGCPAMGAEVLEEMVSSPCGMRPRASWAARTQLCLAPMAGGDGEWMRSWEADCEEAMVNLVCESVICMAAPDDTAIEACKALGKAVAG